MTPDVPRPPTKLLAINMETKRITRYEGRVRLQSAEIVGTTWDAGLADSMVLLMQWRINPTAFA